MHANPIAEGYNLTITLSSEFVANGAPIQQGAREKESRPMQRHHIHQPNHFTGRQPKKNLTKILLMR